MSDLPWHEPDETPPERGWYEVAAIDDRWEWETRYRGWGNGLWCPPLPDGWISGPVGVYRWRGPVADIMGPAPDGTNPR